MKKLYLLLPILAASIAGCSGSGQDRGPRDSSVAATITYTNLDITSSANVEFTTSFASGVNELQKGKSVTLHYGNMHDGDIRYPNIQVVGDTSCQIAEIWPTTLVRFMPLIASKKCSFGFGDDPNIDCHGIYTIICGILNNVALQAKNASEPVTISLTHHSEQSLQAEMPVQLSNSNQYRSTAKLQPGSKYNVSVSPMLDSHDNVASFPSTVSSASKNVKVEYKSTGKYLLAPVAADSFNQSALQAQHYNAAIIAGLNYKTGHFVENNTIVDLHQLRNSADFSSFIELNASDLTQPGINSALPQDANVIVNLNNVAGTGFVGFCRDFIKQHPQSKLSFALPAHLGAAQSTALQGLLQELMNNNSGWHGFVVLPASAMQQNNMPAYLSAISKQHVVAQFATQAELNAGAKQLAAHTLGVSVAPTQNTAPMNLAKAVFLG